MTRIYRILGLIGDGIAEEIVPEAVKTLKAAEEAFSLNLEILGPYPFGAKYYLDSGRTTAWHPEITRELIYEADGIFEIRPSLLNSSNPFHMPNKPSPLSVGMMMSGAFQSSCSAIS